jgi:hypothetical protein
MVSPTLITAGANLLGGFLNRRAQRKANEANRPVNQVKEWEAAGINPLFGISSGGYIPHQASTAIGDSVATAGGIFAEHLAGKKEQELRETQLEQENETLKKQLDKVVKPSVPGHMETYGDILPLPSNGVRNANSESDSRDLSGALGAGVSFGTTQRVVATGRELEVAPYSSGPGFTEIYNDLTGPLVVPGSNGEPMGIDEVATVAVAIPINYGVRLGQKFGEYVDGARAREKMRRIYEQVREVEKLKAIGDGHWGKSLPRSIAPTQSEIDKFNYRRNVFGGQ